MASIDQTLFNKLFRVEGIALEYAKIEYKALSEEQCIQVNTTGLTDFHSFPNLPRELRFQVWKFAAVPADDPRVLHYPASKDIPYPAIAHANRESRAIHFEIYVPLCDPRSSIQTHPLRINFERDVLVLETPFRRSNTRRLYRAPTPFHAAVSTLGPCLRELRYLRIAVETALHGIHVTDNHLSGEGNILKLIGAHCPKLERLFVQLPPMFCAYTYNGETLYRRLVFAKTQLMWAFLAKLKVRGLVQEKLCVSVSSFNPLSSYMWSITADLTIEEWREIYKTVGGVSM